MEEMTRDKAIKILLKHNPDNRRHGIELFVSAFLSYLEAERNIKEKGSVVAHPRTGAPIDNPYLKVRSSMLNDMNKCGNLEGLDELWSKAGL